MPHLTVEINGLGRFKDNQGTREGYSIRAYEQEGPYVISETVVKKRFYGPVGDKTAKELAEAFRLEAPKHVEAQKAANAKKAKGEEAPAAKGGK